MGLSDVSPKSIVRLDGRQDFDYVVAAFYTESYRPHVERLLASLKSFNIPAYIAEYPDLSHWERATCLKPFFLRHALAENPGTDVLYVDADAEFMALPPATFDGYGDVTVSMNRTSGPKGEWFIGVATGTILFRDTENARRFVDCWCDETATLEKYQVDRDSFSAAVDRTHDGSFGNLPHRFIRITGYAGDDVVILHHQASRGELTLKVRKKRMRATLRIVAAALAVIGAGLAFWWMA